MNTKILYCLSITLATSWNIYPMTSLVNRTSHHQSNHQLKTKLFYSSAYPTVQKERPFILNLDSVDDKQEHHLCYSIRPALYNYITNVSNILLHKIRILHDRYGFAKINNYLWWRNYSDLAGYSLSKKECLSKLKFYQVLKRQDGAIFPELDECSKKIEELLDGPDCNPAFICHSLNIFFNYIQSLYNLLVFENKTRTMTQEEKRILDLCIKSYQLNNVFIWAVIPILLRLPTEEASLLLEEIVNSSYFKYFSKEEKNIIQCCMIKKELSINELYQE